MWKKLSIALILIFTVQKGISDQISDWSVISLEEAIAETFSKYKNTDINANIQNLFYAFYNKENDTITHPSIARIIIINGTKKRVHNIPLVFCSGTHDNLPVNFPHNMGILCRTIIDYNFLPDTSTEYDNLIQFYAHSERVIGLMLAESDYLENIIKVLPQEIIIQIITARNTCNSCYKFLNQNAQYCTQYYGTNSKFYRFLPDESTYEASNYDIFQKIKDKVRKINKDWNVNNLKITFCTINKIPSQKFQMANFKELTFKTTKYCDFENTSLIFKMNHGLALAEKEVLEAKATFNILPFYLKRQCIKMLNDYFKNKYQDFNKIFKDGVPDDMKKEYMNVTLTIYPANHAIPTTTIPQTPIKGILSRKYQESSKQKKTQEKKEKLTGKNPADTKRKTSKRS